MVDDAGSPAPVRSLDSARRARAADPEPLWRHLVGDELRARRRDQGRTLADTAARAGVSPQYLSEMERGLKDASSEMIAAVAGALGSDLVDLTSTIADRLRQRPGAASDTAPARQGAVLAFAA